MAGFYLPTAVPLSQSIICSEYTRKDSFVLAPKTSFTGNVQRHLPKKKYGRMHCNQYSLQKGLRLGMWANTYRRATFFSQYWLRWLPTIDTSTSHLCVSPSAARKSKKNCDLRVMKVFLKGFRHPSESSPKNAQMHQLSIELQSFHAANWMNNLWLATRTRI